MKKSELKVYVIATGIKKRCRKASRENISLGIVPLDSDKQALNERAMTLIAETMKSCDKAVIHFDYVETDQDGVFSIMEWQPFDDRHEVKTIFDSTSTN